MESGACFYETNLNDSSLNPTNFCINAITSLTFGLIPIAPTSGGRIEAIFTTLTSPGSKPASAILARY